MKNRILYITAVVIVFSAASAFKMHPSEKSSNNFKFPYKQAGLTEKQAAAHLVSRFSFGATPGEVEEVAQMGLEKWFTNQLDAQLSDDSLNIRLAAYPSLAMSNEEINKTYPNNGLVLKQAIKDSVIDSAATLGDRKAYQEELKAYMEKHGLRPQYEANREVINQKIIRAVYSNNQLQEVLTSFWFNHFNVTLQKSARYVMVYERDAIRPNVTGSFENLLLATAQSPAMLDYLDNYRSIADKDEMNPAQQRRQQRQMKAMEEAGMSDSMQMAALPKNKNRQGLNENYAREIMELHTLGVDGGYTQADVTMAAKVLTGWTINQMDAFGNPKKPIEPVRQARMIKQGFVEKGDFLFAANRHDTTEKQILKQTFPAGGGYQEGLDFIHMIANHPSTARFISTKLARRFVQDNPPKTLIDKMTKTFTSSGGNIRQVLITMASSPEFWSKQAVREKTKSPFEMAISTVRALNADVQQPYQLYNWINKMGENIYNYQAPTGFPDKSEYWINTGSLLYRMNFGLALATKKIPGISFNLLALNNNHEPESAEEALLAYGKILMPQRDLSASVKRLTPLLTDPELVEKVQAAANKTAVPANKSTQAMPASMMMDSQPVDSAALAKKNRQLAQQKAKEQATMLAQVVGIIVGSPEFQRR